MEGSLPSLLAAHPHSRDPWVALGRQRFGSKYHFLALLLNHVVTLEMPSATTLAEGVGPPLLHRAQQPVTEWKRWKNHGPGGTCPTSHPISHETSRCSGPASGLSRVQTEALPNECSHCEPPWEFVILSLELSGVFPFSHLCTEHRIFHSIHFPSNNHLDFPSPALMKKSVRTHSFLPGTIWCHFSPQIIFGYSQLSPQTRDAHAPTPQQLSARQPGSGHPTAVWGRARSLATLRILAVSKPLLVLWESRTNPGGSANGF